MNGLGDSYRETGQRRFVIRSSISLQLVSAETGQPTQTITSAKPGRVIATVSGITSPQVVTFTTTVGEIPVPTAITNGANQAVVDILAGSSLGAGTVTASLSEEVTASLAFAVGATNLRMGSGIPFQEGVAQVGAAQISAGGTTVVSVTIVDENGNPFSEPVDVNFSSSCSSQATPAATLSSPVTTVNGVATSTYLAQGCVGDDAINGRRGQYRGGIGHSRQDRHPRGRRCRWRGELHGGLPGT